MLGLGLSIAKEEITGSGGAATPPGTVFDIEQNAPEWDTEQNAPVFDTTP